NPAFFGVIPGMFAYKQSFLQNTLAEWHGAGLWPLRWYNGLLIAGAAVMAAAWRRVRVADWVMFLVFGALALAALRNVIFIGLIAPIVLATYLPRWKRSFPRVAEYAVAAAIIAFTAVPLARGEAFQLRVASWKFPDG